MPRSAYEIQKFEESYIQFVREINAGGIERYYDSSDNACILRDAMLKLQREQWANNPVDVWNVKIWHSVYGQNVSKLESRPPEKTRAEKELELHLRDRKDGQRVTPARETREQAEAREAEERKQALAQIQKEKDRIAAERKAAEDAEVLKEDQIRNPIKYVPAELSIDYTIDATPAQMWKMPAPVLKYWDQRHKQALIEQQQQAARDKYAARVLKDLVS